MNYCKKLKTTIQKRMIETKNLSKLLNGPVLAWNVSKRSNKVMFSTSAENDKSEQIDTCMNFTYICLVHLRKTTLMEILVSNISEGVIHTIKSLQ